MTCILTRQSTADGQKTPQSKFTFDSERDSRESEICRKLGNDSKECITVSRWSWDPFSTETLHFSSLVEDELETTVRVYAGSGILLRTPVGPLADSHGMHSYTKELMATPCFEP